MESSGARSGDRQPLAVRCEKMNAKRWAYDDDDAGRGRVAAGAAAGSGSPGGKFGPGSTGAANPPAARASVTSVPFSASDVDACSSSGRVSWNGGGSGDRLKIGIDIDDGKEGIESETEWRNCRPS